MELTEKQYNYIAICVEVCHRVACGDVRFIDEILPISPNYELLDKIKRQIFPELGEHETYSWDGGYNNHDFPETFREIIDKFQAQGYQIYREMCYIHNKAKGIDNVLSSPTLTTHKADKPIIKVIMEKLKTNV